MQPAYYACIALTVRRILLWSSVAAEVADGSPLSTWVDDHAFPVYYCTPLVRVIFAQSTSVGFVPAPSSRFASGWKVGVRVRLAPRLLIGLHA